MLNDDFYIDLDRDQNDRYHNFPLRNGCIQIYRTYSEPKPQKIQVTIAKRGSTQDKMERKIGRVSPSKKTFSMT